MTNAPSSVVTIVARACLTAAVVVGPPAIAGNDGAAMSGAPAPFRVNGVRLPADPALKTAMAEIRRLTLNAHTLVTHRRMPPDDAFRFSDAVKAQLRAIKSAPARPPEAGLAVDGLIGQIDAGAEAVAGLSGSLDRIGGIVAIDEALALYGKTFDDPDWRALR